MMPVPEVGDDDALVRVVCGLCGTDHEQHTGKLSGGFAFVFQSGRSCSACLSGEYPRCERHGPRS